MERKQHEQCFWNETVTKTKGEGKGLGPCTIWEWRIGPTKKAELRGGVLVQSIPKFSKEGGGGGVKEKNCLQD